MEMELITFYSNLYLLVNVGKYFYDKNKPLKIVGLKAIGHFKRMAVVLPKNEFIYGGGI
jgi:hypothetical protein